MQSKVTNLFSAKELDGESFQISFVPMSEIEIDNGYQREIDYRHVAEIVKDFNINELEPIKVNCRSGKKFCFDGGHRLQACIEMGYSLIPCRLYHVSREEEIELYIHQQENSKKTQIHEKWKGWKATSDPVVLEIQRFCDKHSFVINSKKSTKARWGISAIKGLVVCYNTIGAKELDDTLYIISKAWEGAASSTKKCIFMGIATVLHRCNVVEKADIDRMASVLSKVTPKGFMARASELPTLRNTQERVSKVVIDMYNNKLSESRKLQWWGF